MNVISYQSFDCSSGLRKQKPTNQPNTQIKSQSLVSRHIVGYKYTEELEPKT